MLQGILKALQEHKVRPTGAYLLVGVLEWVGLVVRGAEGVAFLSCLALAEVIILINAVFFYSACPNISHANYIVCKCTHVFIAHVKICPYPLVLI